MTLRLLKLTTLLMMSLSISNCASVQRPDALICGINSKSMNLRCYNIKKDFDDSGVRTGHQPSVQKISSIQQLNGGIYVSPKDFEKLKVYIQDLRDYSKEYCQ